MSCAMKYASSRFYSFHVVGVGGLFFPSSPELVVNRPQPPSTSEKCPVHNISMDYWCYADEVMLCSSCRISIVTLVMTLSKIQDKNKEELDSLYGAADEARGRTSRRDEENLQ